MFISILQSLQWLIVQSSISNRTLHYHGFSTWFHFEHSFFVSLNPAAEELKAPVRIFLDSKMPVTRLWAISRLPEYPEYLIILIKRLMGYLMICLTLTESPWYPWFLVRVPKTGFVNQKSRQSVSKSHAHHKKVKKSLYKPLWSDTPYSQVT